MLRAPKGATFEKMKMGKKTYLVGVLGRLENDVGTYLECVSIKNEETGVGIGFWGSLRLLMPVVEALANTYEVKPETILKDNLNVKTPKLVWVMYRHTLAHNDLPQHGRYGTTEATWGVSMFGSNHIIQNEVVSIDVAKLYKDLVAFLKNEIRNSNDDEKVDVITGVVWTNPDAGTATEFEYLAR
jgi:hypothetical protein